MIRKIIKLISTFGGLGYSRIAPGTAASLGAAAVYLIVKQNPALYAMITAALLLSGFAVCGRAEELYGTRDARPIVIDEVCGLLIALFLIPFSYPVLIIGFLLFRTMDIVKPFPIRRIENLSGSLGIMGDDILAGIYANTILRLALKFLS